MGCLYLITFPNGKRYVGISSRTAETRFREHVLQIPHRATALHRALGKYGHKNVKLETLGWSDDFAHLCELERQSIVALNTKAPHGYNLTDGGEGALGWVAPDEWREAASKRWKGVPKPPFTDEHRANIAKSARASTARKERVTSPETRALLSKAGKAAHAAHPRKSRTIERTPEQLAEFAACIRAGWAAKLATGWKPVRELSEETRAKYAAAANKRWAEHRNRSAT